MRDIALTVLIFGLLPACLLRPWIGIVVWYWLGLMNPHRHTWDFAYDMPFAAIVGGVTLVGIFFAKDRKPIARSGVLMLVGVLFAYFVFTTFFAWAPDYAWPQLKKVAKIVLITFVATMFIYGKERIYALMLTIVGSIGFYGVKGAYFTITTGGGERVQGPDGSFMEGNTFIGLAFCMVLPLIIYLARDEQRPWLKRGLYLVAFLTVISTVFTYSRGAYLGLAAIIPLIFWRSKSKWLALAIIAPAVVLAPILLPESVFRRAEQIEKYEEDSSANQRLQSWTVAWNLALDRPLTGAGFEFEYAPDNSRWMAYGSEKYNWAINHSSAAHSIYFQVMGQHGFVAFALFVAMLVGTQIVLQRIRFRAGGSKGLAWVGNYATGLQIGLVGYMVSGAFLSSAYFDLLYLYVALTAILWREVTSGAEALSGSPVRSRREQAFMLTPKPAAAANAAPDGFAGQDSGLGRPMPSQVDRAH